MSGPTSKLNLVPVPIRHLGRTLCFALFQRAPAMARLLAPLNRDGLSPGPIDAGGTLIAAIEGKISGSQSMGSLLGHTAPTAQKRQSRGYGTRTGDCIPCSL
eukprot:SAG31_NODE_400_length_16240_cov_5.159098_6_plen_102_part_00